MKSIPPSRLLFLLLLISPCRVEAQNTFVIDGHTFAGGGGMSTGGIFSLSGTAGQADATSQAMTGGGFALSGGLWSILAGPADDAGIVIFNNTTGTVNGGSAVSATTWLGGKFAPGAQAYLLNSVSLLLNNQDFSGAAGPPCEVQLRIYASDPVSGKPSISTGLVMELTDGRTNPITLKRGQELVRWKPASPFTLLPRTAYWAVLSAENGKRMGQLGSVTRPVGGAGTFGASVTTDSGGAWSSPAAAGDVNNKMLIKGTPVPAPVSPTIIFDNTPGEESGGFGASTTQWLAGKFSLGAQAYRLDSLSLLLSSGNFSGNPQPPTTLRLQIYSHDPASGKPLAMAGPVMNLADLDNPVTLETFHLVKWIPETPFNLLAGASYWAVLSIENGPAAGWIHTGRTPEGDAGTFGFTRSVNSGAAWVEPSDSLNYKMRIEGVPSIPSPPAPPVTEQAADTESAIPGGTGNFTEFLTGPALGGNNLAFYGAGGGGQQGFYFTVLGSMPAPSLIADLNTPIPGGAGSFLSFGAEAGIIIVSGDTAVFAGGGFGGQRGIYGTVLTPPGIGPLLRIADADMDIPGGIGKFTDFPYAPGLGGGHAIFTGVGGDGQRGVYAAVFAPPQAGPPLRIADTATTIPGGVGNFEDFPGAPAISNGNAVFAGTGAGGQRGVYGAVFAPPQAGPPLRIADTAMAIPDGTGNFTDFGSEAGIIIVSGNTAVFSGTGAGGQRGIYASVFAPPQVGPPSRIADTATAIPGGIGTFTAFGETSVSETDVAFLGHGTNGQTGIYDRTGGQLLKVIAVGETIGGRTITGLKLSRAGVFGDPVAFQATFADGSQGVYRLAVDSPGYVFRITGVEQEGNDLRLSFNSKVGSRYVIQSSADLLPETWIPVPGPAISGNGGIVQQILPGGLTGGSRQFYRVLQQP